MNTDFNNNIDSLIYRMVKLGFVRNGSDFERYCKNEKKLKFV